jgi:hypothetical protein
MPGTPRLLIASLLLALIAGTQVAAQSGQDPHRPACTTARCRKIESFLKKNYCGESPFGNGPDDGCEIKAIRKPQIGVDVIADYTANGTKRRKRPSVNNPDKRRLPFAPFCLNSYIARAFL